MHQINTYWQIILWLTVGLGFNWWTHGLWNLTTLLLILPGFFVVALTMIPTGLVSYLVAKREEPGEEVTPVRLIVFVVVFFGLTPAVAVGFVSLVNWILY